MSEKKTLGLAKPLAPLQKVLGHAFVDEKLLEEALTHPSAAGANSGAGNYQRLEFLGDRVLAMCMAEILMEAFPAATEGELARRHAAVVREDALVEIAAGWHIADVIKFGRGEKVSGGALKPSILADVVEAVLAAVWLDGGWEAVRDVVRRDWAKLVRERDGIDAKTRLQEMLQAEGLELPDYDVMSERGPDHARIFRVRVKCDWGEAEAEGKSKQAASMAAAEMLMVMLEARKLGHLAKGYKGKLN